MKKKFFVLFSFIASSLLGVPPSVPSSGVIERQIEKEYEEKPLEIEKKVPEIQIDVPKEQLKIPVGVKVYINKVKFQGNRSVSSAKLQRFLRNSFGCEMSMTDIYTLCKRIEEYYASKGFFLARAYPPLQKIAKGKLRICILEGELGNVRVEGNKYYSTKFILRYFSKMQNHPLRYDKFLRALMLLNENSDLSAGAIFEKGKESGQADVIIRVEDHRPTHLYINGNDYGRYLTTNFRIGGRLDKGSLVTYGDNISIAEVIGFPVDALYFTDVVYTIPIAANGSFLEVAYLTSRFHIQELSDLHLKGRSDIATIKFSHALRRGRSLNCDFFSYFDYKQIKDFQSNELTAFDKLRVLTFGLNFDHNSPGVGRDYLVIRSGFGLCGFLNGLNKSSKGCSRPGAHGNFIKFNLDYDRLQKLVYDSYLYFHGSMQWSPSKLTIPEQIYIGGIDTVRGFPLAVFLGDSGYYVNFEFRLPPFGLNNFNFFGTRKKWKDILQFAAFVDQGGTFLKSERDAFLWGAGVGCIINGPFSLSLTFDVGFPLNHRDQSKDAFFYVKLTGCPF